MRPGKAVRRAAAGLLVVALVLAGAIGRPVAVVAGGPPPGPRGAGTWSFGIIADSQWTVTDDGYNPNTVAANAIRQVDEQFIEAGVDLVIALGDLANASGKVSIDTRALYAQDLYNAGIAFYPLRGNHDAGYLSSGAEMRYAFPQIGTGVNNNTPVTITTATITTTDLINNPPAPRTGITFTVGADFSEPEDVNSANNSVSYAFRYRNATFMLLDQFDVNGNYYNSTIPQQQGWISDTLSTRPPGTHAFVFTHKNILGGLHKDNMFGRNVVPADSGAGQDPGDGDGMDTALLIAGELAVLAAKRAAANDFLAAMQANQVHYVISGHDHHHYESLVTSPDGASTVHQLIAQCTASRFHTPRTPVSSKDAPIQQDLRRVGYYIVTVDGPRVAIDYYGDATGGGYYGVNGGTFSFVKIASTGYSLNGKANLVAQGASYSMNDDTTVAATMEGGFIGTTMSILTGTNGVTTTTNYGKPMYRDVNTAWIAADRRLASDVLELRGMASEPGGERTDEYVLSMSYHLTNAARAPIASGFFGLQTRDAAGRWGIAAAHTLAVSRTFVSGPWSAGAALGTYGVDTATHTAWAVLDYNGDFAVGSSEPSFLPWVAGGGATQAAGASPTPGPERSPLRFNHD